MKKIICCLMAVVLSLGFLGNSSQSVKAEEAIPLGVLELAIESGYYEAGDVLEVKLYVHNYPIGAIDFLLRYDKDVLEIKEQSAITYNNLGANGEKLSWKTMVFDEFEEKGIEYLNIAMMEENLEDACILSESGYLATIPFTVKKDFSETVFEWSDIYAVTEDYVEGWYEKLTYTYSNDMDQEPGEFKISTNSRTVTGGQVTTMSLNITKNTGFCALGIKITYDKEICEYVNLAIAEKFKDKVSLKSVYVLPEGGEVRASFVADKDIDLTATFALLSFMVKEDAAGKKCGINIEVEQVTNTAESEIKATGGSGTLTVAKGNDDKPVTYKLGDVNEDGSIDLIDAVHILHWYNGERQLSATQKLAADTDKNGVVNLLDALQVMRYFNGEIRSF